MKVTFVKETERRYSVIVRRDRAPDLRCGSIGCDAWLPHDLLHFVAEAEYGLDGAVFGDLAAGGNARTFMPLDESDSVDMELVTKLWRKKRIKPTKLADGRRSEELAAELHRGWQARTLPPALQSELDNLAARWNALQPGRSLTLEWPRPEGRRYPARDRRRPAASRRR